MMLKELFDVFSRRQEKFSSQRKSKKSQKPLTNEFKSRLFSILISDRSKYTIHSEHWIKIHEDFTILLGRHSLSNQNGFNSIEDLFAFLNQCSDEHYLDFIEYILKYLGFNCDELVDDINHLFEIDDLPYAVTKLVREKKTVKKIYDVGGEKIEHPEDYWTVVSYPKIICREDQVTHSFVIEPVLNLLSDERFKSANQEFLEALEDYRKGDYGDCLTKCGSAFESTMKIICNLKQWPYDQKDTASKLIEIIIISSKLENYFKELLMIVATLRNRLSKSHGAGIQKRIVPKHKAKYAINATALNILLIVEECL